MLFHAIILIVILHIAPGIGEILLFETKNLFENPPNTCLCDENECMTAVFCVAFALKSQIVKKIKSNR